MTIFLSTNRLAGLFFAMAILLAGRAMFSATTTTTTSSSSSAKRTTTWIVPTNFVLPLDFLAMSVASSWKSQYQQQQQQQNMTMNVIKEESSARTTTTTQESSTAGARVKEVQEHEQTAHYFKYDDADETTSPSHYPLVIFYNIFIPSLSDNTDTNTDNDDDVDDAMIQNALHIVTQQIQQIRQSYAASLSLSFNNNQTALLTVFYNTIGNPTALNHSFMQNLCTGPLLHSNSSSNNNNISIRGGDGDERQSLLLPKIHCRHLQHFLTGHEEKTLNHLHTFCVQHSNYSVVYLHSKGSFHNRPYNEAWRPHLTAAATSRMCIDAVVVGSRRRSSRSSNSTSSSSANCNLCSLQFYPMWSMFVPGNMWLASCDYVQHLLPLTLFHARMKQVEHDVQQDLRYTGGSGGDTTSRIWKATLYPWSPMTVGTRRWSNEHWIATHPHVVPCDLSQTARLQPWQKQQQQQQSQGDQEQLSRQRMMITTTTRANDNVTVQNMKTEYVWAMAPRHPITSMRYQLNLKRLHNLLQLSTIIDENVTDMNDHHIPANDRFREWFLLPGFLMKWNVLYQDQSSLSPSAFPPSSSWIWKWFPDGDFWKASVQKWGLNQTVARILRRHGS